MKIWKIKSYLVSDIVVKTQNNLFISSLFVSSVVACLLLPTQTKADNSVFSSNSFNSSDVNLSKEKSNIQITPYGVGGKVADKDNDLKSYHGIGLRADGKDFQVKMEKWAEHYLMGGVGVFDVNNGFYIKGGASVLKDLADVKTQTLGGAVGYQKQLSFGYINLEGGKLFHKVTWVNFNKVDGDTSFIEGAVGSQFSFLNRDFGYRVAGSASKMEAQTHIWTDFEDKEYNTEFTLYPNDNNSLSLEYSNRNKVDGAYGVHAGISLSTADWKKFETSPYLASSYDNNHAKFSYEYRLNVAKQNPALMNSFENAVYIKNSTMQKAITKAVEESKSKEAPNEAAPNQAPTAQNASFDMQLDDRTQTFDLAPYIADSQDPDSALQIVIVLNPTYLNITQSWTNISLTPTDWTGYNWNDSFTYKVIDSAWAESAVKTVTVSNIIDF